MKNNSFAISLNNNHIQIKKNKCKLVNLRIKNITDKNSYGKKINIIFEIKIVKTILN